MNLDDLARLRDLPVQPSAFSTGLAGAAIKRAARVQALATTAIVAGATTVLVIVAFVAGVFGLPGGSDDTPGVTVTTSAPGPRPSQTEPASSAPSPSDSPTSSSATPSGTAPAQSDATTVPPVIPGTTASGSQQPPAQVPGQAPTATASPTDRPTTSRPTRTPTRPVPMTSSPIGPSPTPTPPPVTSPEPTTPTDPVTTPTVAPVPACNTVGHGDLQVAGWQVENQDGQTVVKLELHNPAENRTCQLTDSVWADVKPASGGWQELASGNVDTLVESGDSMFVTIKYSVARGCEVPSAELRVRIGQSMGPYESTELVPTPSKWFTCPRG